MAIKDKTPSETSSVTLRIPVRLKRALRVLAASERRSLNQQCVHMLAGCVAEWKEREDCDAGDAGSDAPLARSDAGFAQRENCDALRAACDAASPHCDAERNHCDAETPQAPENPA